MPAYQVSLDLLANKVVDHIALERWARAQLARFTYKPGWTFSVQLTFYGPAVRIMFDAPDTYNPDRTVSVGSLQPIPPFMREDDDDGFARWLASHIRDAEIHEAREWLRRDGEIFDNPHATD